ncbi:unnamed protein product (macronuclear) [Paramecium tetraurelia]|uniref:Endoplasmic reticulum vesicle transporter C-terminal domain-containing protein n=1 Tax=Paramecium tetraurelia TaxID=5888 RepID=A0ECL1_PARTE|nr:uncharacterized protein GSPATT00003897001 [Paramecium tetraurelia]CAK93028.1 unnamed protein product [Paramecium tetraurelia]|eukprot:XP_001460425.1 hypothetical protein (macronuclear) [Paramecium tetraurelia strain d4-2]
MKLLKSIDLYGKVPKGLAEPTSSGAVVSIITLILLALMIINEGIEYITIDVQSEIIVDQKLSKDRVQVNLDIKFIKAPCDFLEIDQQDAMGQSLSQQFMELKYYRLDSNERRISEYTRNSNNWVEIEDARTAINEKQGCEVIGNLKVNRVRGKISFGAHRSYSYIGAVGNLNLPLDYSHKFVSFSFGDEDALKKVKSLFQQGQLDSFAGTQRIKKPELASQSMQHEHFISIIPTHYTLLNKQVYSVYQYTANHNEVRSNNYGNVQLRYDFAPTTVTYWQTKEDILHFYVQICAVIGGIFTVSSMIEACVYKVMRMLLKVE